MWNGECLKNHCMCPHGKAKTSSGKNDRTVCAFNNTIDCISCDKGYYLSDSLDDSQGMFQNVMFGLGIVPQVCRPYEGTCANGVLIAQSERTQHDHCGKCNNGYHLVNKACHRNVCTCNNGNASVAWGGQTSIDGAHLCEQHGQEDCVSCDAGYTLNAPAGKGQQKCVATKCTCANGLAAFQYDRHDDNDGMLCEKDQEDCY